MSLNLVKPLDRRLLKGEVEKLIVTISGTIAVSKAKHLAKIL